MAVLAVTLQAQPGSLGSQMFKSHVMDVANAKGEVIYPGELAKGLENLAAGGEIVTMQYH